MLVETSPDDPFRDVEIMISAEWMTSPGGGVANCFFLNPPCEFRGWIGVPPCYKRKLAGGCYDTLSLYTTQCIQILVKIYHKHTSSGFIERLHCPSAGPVPGRIMYNKAPMNVVKREANKRGGPCSSAETVRPSPTKRGSSENHRLKRAGGRHVIGSQGRYIMKAFFLTQNLGMGIPAP